MPCLIEAHQLQMPKEIVEVVTFFVVVAAVVRFAVLAVVESD